MKKLRWNQCREKRCGLSVLGLELWKMNMNLSRTTLKKAHAYCGVCEFCGSVGELSYYDSVLESAVCGECAQDLATGENELLSAGMVPPG
jgi:hypothetical protein